MEICVDEYGYIYILEPSGAKRYILVDVPNCQHYGKLILGKENEECDLFKPKTMTNADRIRAMTDEELAKYLDGVCHDLWQMFVKDPQKMWLDWLKEEAEDD